MTSPKTDTEKHKPEKNRNAEHKKRPKKDNQQDNEIGEDDNEFNEDGNAEENDDGEVIRASRRKNYKKSVYIQDGQYGFEEE